MTYTPTIAEAGNIVTVDYLVCFNSVCDTATVNINVQNCTDTDGDGICDVMIFPNDPCQPRTDPNWVVQPGIDCDDDGNPDTTDPNPTVATAVDDTATATAGEKENIDILANDDFIPGSNIAITNLGPGTGGAPSR